METQDNSKITEVKRLDNLDLLKCLALVFMMMCHPVFMLGQHYAGYESDIRYFVADTIFGDYLFVAHAFMFAMGVGFVYSHRQDAMSLFKRGVSIYILSYVLNFLRYGIYPLAEGLVLGQFRSETFYAIVSPDILMFAGCAMMLTALFRKLKFSPNVVFGISIVMSMLGSVLVFGDIENTFLDLLVGTFFVTTPATGSCFTLFNWYVFVGFGMFFAGRLKVTEDRDAMYKRLLILSAGIMVIYVICTCRYGCFFLTKNAYYEETSLLETIGLLSIDMTALSAGYFFLKKVDLSKYFDYHAMSKNILKIYCIHWMIIGFIDSIFGYGLEILFPYWSMYLIGVLLVIFVPKMAKRVGKLPLVG